MISGARSLLALALLSASACALAWDLGALMQEMAQVESSHSRFVERRHVALLTQPLELKGRLSYERPSRLTKHVESPFDELLTVNGDTLTLLNRTKGEQRLVSLREQPGVGALVESIRATLAGDAALLERHYRVRLSGARDAWRMRLEPRARELKGHVESIELAGAAARLQRIEVRESSGDHSVMTIVHDGK